MAIKPIDMQTNISQMHEVGRGEHVKAAAVAEQQQQLDKLAGEKSRLVNEKLDETKKGDGSPIRAHEQKDERGKKNPPRKGILKKDDKDASGQPVERVSDGRSGKIIDVLK